MDRREFLGTVVAVAAGKPICARPAFGAESPGGQESGKPALPSRMLGKTGVKISALILGGVAGMKEPPTAKFHPAELANAALDAGITYFDTAPSYNNGQSERNYGEVLATRRKEVFLAGKTDNRSYDGAMRQVEASLQRLRTDRLDLLQVHGVTKKEDFSKWDAPDGVLKALDKLRAQKVTRFIGVTGHENAEAMRRAIELFDFDTILTTFNPTVRRLAFQQRVLPLARQKQMGVLAMKIMGGGLGSLAVGNPIKNDGVWYHDAAPRQAEPGMLIRYALGLPISAAVVGMGSLDHLKVNVAAVRDARPLNEQERRELEERMS
jgi:aryl-alcohol dehydrogenase-like predicted oxidoreductase